MAEIMPGYDYHKPRSQSKHKESDLHLTFCKWVKKWYPDLQFVRHEREKKRSKFMSNLMRVYNTDWDKLPDFELLATSIAFGKTSTGIVLGSFGQPYHYTTSEGGGIYNGFYLEFKRPGRSWTLADGKTLAAGFEAQYACHMHLWSIGRCAYFCNDFEDAKQKLKDYVDGSPQPKQDYIVRVKDEVAFL